MGHADPDEQSVMTWIRSAAVAIRTEHDRKPVHIAAELNVNQSTVTRFESGDTTQIDLDAMIAGYSRDTDVPPIEFLRRAVEMWQARLDGAGPAARLP